MRTFAEILNEASLVMEMASSLTERYMEPVQVKQNAPCIIIPATETKQGEQKAPVAKPNGVTR